VVVFGRENQPPLNALDSTVEITEITETQITGKRSESLTDENTVEGSFTVNICSNQ